MRSSVGLLCAILAFMAAGCAQSADLRWQSEMVAQIDGLEDVRRDHGTGDVVILAGDKRATLKLLDGKFVLRDGAPRDPVVPGADPIPDGRIAGAKALSPGAKALSPKPGSRNRPPSISTVSWATRLRRKC